MSSRSEVSSPITCIGCLQQGQFVSAGATVSWMRGQIGGQRAAINPPFPQHIGGLRVLLDRRGLGDHLLDIFKRQFDKCCGTRSWRRATSAITPPGAIASATILPFSSALQCRRRNTRVTPARHRIWRVVLCSIPAISSRACGNYLHKETGEIVGSPGDPSVQVPGPSPNDSLRPGCPRVGSSAF